MTGALEKFLLGVGHAACWANGILVLVIVLQVILRYVFNSGMVMLEELEWHLYAVGILFGLSYCVTNGSHVRMDLISSRFSPRTREIIESLGILILLLPFVVAVFLHGMDFLGRSWVLNERSDAPLGLPFRWIIKSAIPLSFLMLGLAGLARLVRSFQIIIRRGGHGTD
ncbi:MAG: TRAP transporter small permease subunit [Proteobacteria bacterium]|nr:TRAP transporter small permease subunit [Pseudomonadota bacterium]